MGGRPLLLPHLSSPSLLRPFRQPKRSGNSRPPFPCRGRHLVRGQQAGLDGDAGEEGQGHCFKIRVDQAHAVQLDSRRQSGQQFVPVGVGTAGVGGRRAAGGDRGEDAAAELELAGDGVGRAPGSRRSAHQGTRANFVDDGICRHGVGADEDSGRAVARDERGARRVGAERHGRARVSGGAGQAGAFE